jgi:hypothetical protein
MSEEANKVRSTTPNIPTGVVEGERISPEVRAALSKVDPSIKAKVLDVVNRK